MKNPCKPDCKRRDTYCHVHCKDYKKWKEQYKTSDPEQQEYISYVTGAVKRMKGLGRWC